ncbi:MAG: DUF5059 domain-containing protein [Haloferacaceae archaeon]
MATNRRDLLRTLGLTVSAATLAGCTGGGSTGGTATPTTDDDGTDHGGDTGATAGADLAVAAQWNVYRARFDDAAALATAGEFAAAADVATDTFARFESATGEYGAHERLESTSHERYEGFEEELGLVKERANERDLAEVREARRQGAGHLYAAQETLVGESVAHALDLQRLGVRAANARVLATAGRFDAAADVAARTYEAFEDADAHEALESAAPEQYEAFEGGLEGIEEAAGASDPMAVGDAVDETLAAAVEGAYAMAGTEAVGAGELAAMQARGFDAVALVGFGASAADYADAANGLVGDVFGDFEDATVHELLEEADHDAYESFEHALEGLAEAAKAGTDVAPALDAFARASVHAQFAVVGAADQSPVGGGEAGDDGGEPDASLSGGPDVVSGVPDDADHVVEMRAVTFDPDSLTVAAGDTVAFAHVDGDAHTVTAVEEGIPSGADYWNSAGADDQAGAEEAWEHGAGAVQAGQAYVHTFETVGTHEFYCIPHEAAGMTGTITVEKA